jgi:hypothetical protein
MSWQTASSSAIETGRPSSLVCRSKVSLNLRVWQQAGEVGEGDYDLCVLIDTGQQKKQLDRKLCVVLPHDKPANTPLPKNLPVHP